MSVIPPEEFTSYVQMVEEFQREKGVALSVGYMFRYHPAVSQMKSILKQHGRPVMPDTYVHLLKWIIHFGGTRPNQVDQ